MVEKAEESKSTTLNLQEIMERIPHRYPFLLLDKVLELNASEIVAVKNVTFGEEFFQGHFPSHPIMPGVLIVEAMAQAACVLVSNCSGFADKAVYFTTIEKAHFRKPVVPGDQLILKVRVERSREKFWKFTGEAYVDEVKVADASFAAALVKR